MTEKLRKYQRQYNYYYSKIESLLEEELYYLNDPSISILPHGGIFIKGKESTAEELREYVNKLKDE